MKKATAILAAVLSAAVMLTACAEDENTYKDDSFPAEQKEISKLYEGYEELQGKDFGLFKMPETIIPIKINSLNKFSINKTFNIENEEAGKSIFRAFWKDEFDESKCGFSISKEDPAYYYDQDGEEYGYFNNGLISLEKSDSIIIKGGEEYEGLEKYNVETDKDKTVQLLSGTASINDLVESVNQFIADSGIDTLYGDFSIKPKDVYIYKTNKGANALVICSACFNDIPIETYPSHFFKEGYENGFQTITFYLFKYLALQMSGKNNIDSVSIPASYRIYKTEEIKSAISLSDAVNLLTKELASNSKYEFEKIELTYCSKSTKPSDEIAQETEDTEKIKEIEDIIMNMHEEFIPTWCFYIKERIPCQIQSIIKVNAITGEITMDLPN